jgi:hypothetical protein
MKQKRIENVVLLKVIGICELLAGVAMIYFYHDEVPALVGGLLLLGFSANSFFKAHKNYKFQYSPNNKIDPEQ